MVSLATSFWAALGRGERDSAERFVRELRPPAVNHETYSFASSPGDDKTGSAGGGQGAFVMAVAPGTPSSDLGLWNSLSLVGLVELDAGMCLAKASGGPDDSSDFLVCILTKSLSGRKGGKDLKRICEKTSHTDIRGKERRIKRITLEAGDQYYAIMAHSGPGTKQRRCFARPLFNVGDFPPPLAEKGRHKILLEIKATERAWALILRAYPGGMEMWSRYCEEEGVAPSPRSPFPTYLQGSRGELPGEEVIESPGLRLTLKEYHAARASARKAEIEVAATRMGGEGGGICLEFDSPPGERAIVPPMHLPSLPRALPWSSRCTQEASRRGLVLSPSCLWKEWGYMTSSSR